jgi:hypothetical protein
MDTPSCLKLTPDEKRDGCRLVRFLDQIITLNKEEKAIRRSFFPSRNAAKRLNRRFGSFPVLRQNPQNGPNCSNEMIADPSPKKTTKAQKQLDCRIFDYLGMVARSKKDGAEYTRPGSMKAE